MVSWIQFKTKFDNLYDNVLFLTTKITTTPGLRMMPHGVCVCIRGPYAILNNYPPKKNVITFIVNDLMLKMALHFGQ